MIRIREASHEELNFIKEQRVKAYEEHSQSIPQGHWEVLKQAITSDTEKGAETLVAEQNGKIVGSVVLYPEKTDAYDGLADMPQSPEIRMLSVNSENRNQGIGTALMQECIRRVKQRGYSAIGLHTANFMKNAMKLYQQMGFIRVPKFDFQPADDDIIVKAFRLSLSES